MAEKNKILVPIDFSEQSLIALTQSYNLAHILNAEIVLLYVSEEFNELMRSFAPSLTALDNMAKERLDELAKAKCDETNIPFSTHISHGKTYQEIIKFANDSHTVLIVMGTRGAKKNKDATIGSNTLQVLQGANCPVLCIGGATHKQGCDSILLPLDLTKRTSDKVERSIEIAKFFNATIYLLSFIQNKDEFEINRLIQQMESVENRIEKNNVKCAAELIDKIKGNDTFGKNIVNYAERIAADLIVIMTQQENDTRMRHVGGAAQEIIANSSIPILAIPPSGDARNMD